MLARTACLVLLLNEENSFKWSNEWIIHLLIVIFIIVNFSKLEPWKKVSTDYFNAINNGNKECLELVSSPPLFRPILFNFLNLQIQDVLLRSIFLAFTIWKSHCHFGEFLTKAKEVLKLKSQKAIQSIVEDCDNLRVTVT